MKVVFLSWGEVPRLSSVYGGQLVNVARSVGQQADVQSSRLIAGMPLVHSGMVREKWRYGKEIGSIRDRLGPGNFFRRPLIVPPVGIYPTKSQIGLFKLGQMRSMIALLDKLQPDVLHCRSYLATYMAHEWRNASGLKYKILFDTRGYMPDEAIQRSRWTEGSDDHQFWRETEARLLSESDAVNVVSEPMRLRFIGMGAQPARTHLIHLNVEAPESVKSASGNEIMRDDGPLFCYCGYLDYASWHHPSNIWKVFDSIVNIRDDARLLIITKSSHSKLITDLDDKGLNHLKDKISFTSAASSSECVSIMQHCDVGLLSYFTPRDQLALEMAKGVFATKTAEYLYAGIPVLVNNICGGAAEFVNRHNVGLSYDESTYISKSDLETLQIIKTESSRLIDLARHHFSLECNAERLVQIYKSII